MSLFRRESPRLNAVVLEDFYGTSGIGTGGLASGYPAGTLYKDPITGQLSYITPAGTLIVSATNPVPTVAAASVTNTNATTATALQTYAFQPGQLNIVGKAVHVYAAGEYTTDSGSARTVTVALTQGDGTNTRTLATWTSGATTASQTSFPWHVDAWITTQAAGTAGTMFAHGNLFITLGSTQAGASTIYADVNTAVTSALDLTKTNTLSVTQLFSGSNTGNTFTEDMLIVQY